MPRNFATHKDTGCQVGVDRLVEGPTGNFRNRFVPIAGYVVDLDVRVTQMLKGLMDHSDSSGFRADVSTNWRRVFGQSLEFLDGTEVRVVTGYNQMDPFPKQGSSDAQPNPHRPAGNQALLPRSSRFLSLRLKAEPFPEPLRPFTLATQGMRTPRRGEACCGETPEPAADCRKDPR